MINEIKKLLDINQDIYLTLKDLEKMEDGENVDYSNVIEELSWNRMVLKNRCMDLREKYELER